VPFGYVCSSLGFHVSDDAKAKSYGVPPAKVTNHLPYQYARVTTKRAPRYYRLPTVAEERQARLAMEKKSPTPEVVSSLMEGDYFLALAEKEAREADGAVFYRTVRGRYVRVSDVELRNPDPVRGEELGRGGWRLPLAFVWGEDRELLSLNGDAPRVTGKAEKHARFVVEEELRKNGETFVVGAAGAVRRGEVRIARQTTAPSGVPANAKWVHVDLPEQTLVAYEGAKPVYATVISSGKEGYEPPTGLFEVQQKYISTTMNATDPIDGFYALLPWRLRASRRVLAHGFRQGAKSRVHEHRAGRRTLALLLERPGGAASLACGPVPARNDLGLLHQLSAPRTSSMRAAAPAMTTMALRNRGPST
jgi:hypothetical protein